MFKNNYLIKINIFAMIISWIGIIFMTILFFQEFDFDFKIYHNNYKKSLYYEIFTKPMWFTFQTNFFVAFFYTFLIIFKKEREWKNNLQILVTSYITFTFFLYWFLIADKSISIEFKEKPLDAITNIWVHAITPISSFVVLLFSIKNFKKKISWKLFILSFIYPVIWLSLAILYHNVLNRSLYEILDYKKNANKAILSMILIVTILSSVSVFYIFFTNLYIKKKNNIKIN